jgi:hypothetical protein
MSGELLKTMAGIDMLYVPYKSNPQAVTDLLGGQISIFFGDVSTALPPVSAGKLKSYAVSGIKRSPLAPDLTTIDETGLKETTGIGGDGHKYVPAGGPIVGGTARYARLVPMAGPIDWDRNGQLSASGVQADVNSVPDCSAGSVATPGQVLTGAGDWDLLQYAVPADGGSSATRTLVTQVGPTELGVAQFDALGGLQFDCNGNGIPDEQDIASGASIDSNANGIPDECEFGAVTAVAPAKDTDGRLQLSGSPLRRGSTLRIRFSLQVGNDVLIRVLNVRGALVATLHRGSLGRGAQTIAWNGLDADGRDAGSGVYFVALDAGARHESVPLVVVR